MRSQGEIDKQIVSLEALKEKVIPATAFGDDNIAAIDAQIQALREDFDEDDCYQEWPDDEDLRLRDNALEAVAWVCGGSEHEDLCDDWPLK